MSEHTTHADELATGGIDAQAPMPSGVLADAETLLASILASEANRLRRTAYRVCRNMATAEECVYDAAMAVLPHILVATNPIATFHTACRNKALDRVRLKGANKPLLTLQDWDQYTVLDHDCLMVDQIYRRVSPTTRLVLETVADSESLTHAAQTLGIHLGTLRQLLSSVRTILGIDLVPVRLPRLVPVGSRRTNTTGRLDSTMALITLEVTA